jgi:endonuclease/exonuclease/phosphatase family metal-dependent hydrolase
MRIISFNILSDIHIDFNNSTEDYPDVPVEYLYMHNRFPRIVVNIRSFDPDVVLIQEITEDIRQRLIFEFPEYIFSEITFHTDYNSGNMIFFRHDIPYIDSFGLNYENGDPFSIVDFDSFVAINIHLDDTYYDIREGEIIYLLNLISTIDKPVIIGGDFNTNSPKLHQLLTSQGFQSVVKFPTGTYLCESYMIDYIYSRYIPIFHGYIYRGKCRYSCDPRCILDIGSDHFPVIADLI